MNLHRIFIAINLPEDIKEKLLAYAEQWPELPAKWSSKNNLHITLAFLGNTSDQELAEICELLQPLEDQHAVFPIHINSISYGPNPKRPRMIWAHTEQSQELLALQKNIEKKLGQGSDPSTLLRTSKFSPHITLARLKTFELQRMEIEEIPNIQEELSLSFNVESVDIMESELKRTGAQYTICQSIPLPST